MDPVKTSVIAAVLALSVQHVRQLTRDGVFETVDRALYDLAETVQAYIEYCKHGKNTSETAAVRRSLMSEQERRLRLENDERERLLLPAEDVGAVFNEVAQMVASGLDSLGPRCAPKLTNVCFTPNNGHRRRRG